MPTAATAVETTATAAAVETAATAAAVPTTAALGQGRARETGKCHRRRQDQSQFQKRGSFHLGPPYNLKRSSQGNVTVIPHLIPEVNAWLQPAKSRICRIDTRGVQHATNNPTPLDRISFGRLSCFCGAGKAD
jgi:hypothetical protein